MTRSELNQRLVGKGFTSLWNWSERNGLDPHTVNRYVNEWIDRDGKLPGGKLLDILLDLSITVGAPVSPAIAKLFRLPRLSDVSQESNDVTC